MSVNINKRVFKNKRDDDRLSYVVVDQRSAKSRHVGCRDTRERAEALRESYILRNPAPIDDKIRKSERIESRDILIRESAKVLAQAWRGDHFFQV
jgi:hypothetical protein